MTVSLFSHISFYLPEFMAVITMCALLFLEASYSAKEKKRTFVYVSGLIGLAMSAFFLYKNIGIDPVKVFANAVIIDNFSTFLKLTMVIGTAGCFYLSYKSNEIHQDLKSEFLIMSMGVLVGGMLLASANNMLTLYLGIETLSILSYVMSALNKRDSRSTEAGLKYALYGGITAGVMLFGISHLYGIFGSIQFDNIVAAIPGLEGTRMIGALIAFILFFVGIGYKIACFPFHMWSPDVYEGSPVPVTAFFSIVPKLAGIAVVARVTMLFFSETSPLSAQWVAFLQVIAAMTMTVGNITAINQESVKRMLAYSSIGHVGMILLGVIVMNDTGSSAILYYGLIYTFTTLVAFFVTGVVVNRYGSDNHIYFRGLAKTHPILGICFTLALFSLAGIPPFGGFVAKFNMLYAAVNKGLYTLSIIAALNSVISLYFYLRLVKIMTIEEPDGGESFSDYSVPSRVYVIGMIVPVVFLGIFWNQIYNSYSKGFIDTGKKVEITQNLNDH